MDTVVMRKSLILIGMLLAAVFSASAQTGTWSGKLDVQVKHMTKF